jgi:hypothetical protein
MGVTRAKRLLQLAPPAPLGLAIAVLGAYLAIKLHLVLVEFLSGGAGLDYGYDVSAARIGLQHGWAAVYDRRLYGEVTHFGGPLSFVNLPVIAWLAVPFTALPFRVGLALWTLPLVLMLLVCWWSLAPGGGWQRLAHLLAVLAAGPVLFAIDLGQITLAVMGFVGLHWWLLRRGWPVLAGVALGLACVKAQDVFLVPVVLVLTGRWRCAAGLAATVAALALSMVLVLGPGGVAAYRSHLDFAFDPITTNYTLWGHLPGWAPVLPLRAAIVVLALVPGVMARGLEGRSRYGRAAAAAVVGSLLATPYLNAQDLSLLIVAGWFALQAGLPRWARWLMVPSYVAVAYPAGPFPPLSVEVVWLLALAFVALRSRPVGTGSAGLPFRGNQGPRSAEVIASEARSASHTSSTPSRSGARSRFSNATTG